ncbi:hypothetical protein [Nevskia sp.]|uniref:hypothetical protein n=1 Tax=Nevskia sp. TaxID=1929292 RepID=UPI0025E75941|nr:hypothetical protein [Nevskia sp.]
MKRIAIAVLLTLCSSQALQAAGETPDQCFAQAKQLPADRQESFIKACLGEAATQKPSTVDPEQRARVCATIAANEGFKGEQLAAFLKGCKGA